MIAIHPSKEQMLEAATIAHARNFSKIPDSNRRFSKRDDVEVHFEGVLSEICFEMVTGWKMNREIYVHGDGGGDFTAPDGSSIELKARNGKHKDLVFGPGELDCDYLVLCWHSKVTDEMHQIHIVGWVGKDRFLSQARPVNLGYGARLLLKYQELGDIYLDRFGHAVFDKVQMFPALHVYHSEEVQNVQQNSPRPPTPEL